MTSVTASAAKKVKGSYFVEGRTQLSSVRSVPFRSEHRLRVESECECEWAASLSLGSKPPPSWNDIVMRFRTFAWVWLGRCRCRCRWRCRCRCRNRRCIAAARCCGRGHAVLRRASPSRIIFLYLWPHLTSLSQRRFYTLLRNRRRRQRTSSPTPSTSPARTPSEFGSDLTK